MTSFEQIISSWHDFYIMVGTAAATLIGLLFVSLSLNADAITRKENTILRLLAAQSFASFISVLMFAVLFLIPDQSPNGLGLPLLFIDLIGIVMLARRLRQTYQNRALAWSRGGILLRFAIPLASFLTLLIIAIDVLLGNAFDLYWLVPVMILLILDASLNAWNLLLKLRDSNQG